MMIEKKSFSFLRPSKTEFVLAVGSQSNNSNKAKASLNCLFYFPACVFCLGITLIYVLMG